MSYSQYLRSTMSKNWADAHSQVMNLYRKSLRAIPSLIVQYELDLDPRVMAKRIRANIEEYKDANDLRHVDKLLFMGRVDLEEAQSMWKQTTHVEYYFEKENQHLKNINKQYLNEATEFPLNYEEHRHPDERDDPLLDNPEIGQPMRKEFYENIQYREVF